MKKVLSFIIFEIWVIGGYLLVGKVSPWILQIPLTDVLVVGIALIPILAILLKRACDNSIGNGWRVLCVLFAMFIFFAFVIASVITLDGMKFDESIFNVKYQ